MKRTPTPVGVRSLTGELEQMNRLPQPPVSAAIVSDGTDVFLSFRFANDSVRDAENLCRPLGFWLQLFLEMQDVVALRLEVEDLDG